MIIREESGNVRLHVEYIPYDRYDNSDTVKKANITASTELEALTKMCDKMLVYLEPEDVMQMDSVEDVIEQLEESNGDGCDYIILLENLTTGEILMENSYDVEEEEW